MTWYLACGRLDTRQRNYLVHGGREGGVLAENEHNDKEHVHMTRRAARRVIQLPQQRHEQRVQVASHQRVQLRDASG